ncbi:MAG: FkbM family methyltransferase [Pararhodobacter sp.]|nr:FkbM family methyltransferase [Pararhodobacter sp.]
MSDDRTALRRMQGFLQHIRELGYDADTVIDVGVAWGTPDLYAQFPNAYFYLIEAIPVFEEGIKRILQRVSGEYFLVAVGDKSDEIVISIDLSSSALAGANVIDIPENASGEATFKISVDTIDRILASKSIEDGALLKLDVQGADLRALTGATETLKKCEVVIVEASLINKKNKAGDIIDFMRVNDFDLYEIFDVMNRLHDNAQGQIDIAFVRRGSILTGYKGWV